MGIKHLKKLLVQACDTRGIYNFASVNDYMDSEKKRLHGNTNDCKHYFVGIDAYLYAAKYKRIFKKIEYGFLRQIMLTLSEKIIPIYVFDGRAPIQKRSTITRRSEKKKKNRTELENFILKGSNVDIDKISDLSFEDLIKRANEEFLKQSDRDATEEEPEPEANGRENNYLIYDKHMDSMSHADEYKNFMKLTKKSITVENNDIKNLKRFLDTLKIPYITAQNEADDMMAELYKNGIIQACQSDDMDMLPKGCGNVIQINKNGIVQFLLKEILDSLNMTYEQFVDLCILLGSDYYTLYLPKIKAMQLYDIYKSCSIPCIEQFVEKFAIEDPNILSHMDSYIGTRSSFINANLDTKMIVYIDIVPMKYDSIIEYFKVYNINIFLNDKKILQMLRKSNEFIDTLPCCILLHVR